MSHLSKLKIVAQAAKRQQTKTEHRRGKLLESKRLAGAILAARGACLIVVGHG